MKLPDFFVDTRLLELRRLMGANTLGDLKLKARDDTLTEEELDRLSGVGIDVQWNQVRVLPDGTLAYKNSRVILYIRDVHAYGRRSGQDNMPKYHVSRCRTLEEMARQGRSARYVVATRVDGRFQVNLIRSGESVVSGDQALKVCQNCLKALQFDGFDYALDSGRKQQIVRDFTLARFFERYPRSLLQRGNSEDDVTAPLDDYSEDFARIAADLKLRRGYRCEQCGLRLDERQDRRFLHAHHVNGVRYDNAPSNLRVLCLGCHVDEPNHGHMRGSADHREFVARFGHSRDRASATNSVDVQP